jgi:hypothetical protein
MRDGTNLSWRNVVASWHKNNQMMSTQYRYLNCGLLIWVLLLALAPTAGADSAKEQLQGTIDRVVEVLRTIRMR